jgi:hypothetical protein
MRDTEYAREIATASLPSEDSEHRIERIFVKHQNQEEIRFSWWKNGKMMQRPLDLPEGELLPLIEQAIQKRVFSDNFLAALKQILP